MCGPKMEAVVGGQKKSRNYKLRVLFCIPGDVRKMTPISVLMACTFAIVVMA